MSGTIDKVKETLHMGGQKKEGEQKGVYHGEAHKVEQHHGVCKPEHGEHKVGVVQKIKDRVQGQGDQHGHGVEQHRGEYRPEYGEHKEGMVEQIKDKVHGQGDQHGHGVKQHGGEYKPQYGEHKKEWWRRSRTRSVAKVINMDMALRRSSTRMATAAAVTAFKHPNIGEWG